MSGISIKIEDFLSEEDVADIVRGQVREHLDLEGSRLIDNGVYYAVQKIIDEEMLNDPILRLELRNRVKEVIDQGTAFNLFRKADSYDRSRGKTDSEAQTILDQAVRDNAPKIRKKVTDTVNGLGFDSVRQMVIESVYTMWDEQEER